MRSQLDVRLGVQQPQVVHLPPDVHSLAAAEEAIELADAYGICRGHPLDDSQRFTLRAGLGERADGSWAASTVVDIEPRQNGKNDTCAARELAGLILFGEKLILHTAHEFKTANESFLRLVEVFENHDDLRRKVARVRYANGEQGIEMLPKYGGGRLKYSARTGGAGRGFAEADLVVYDECQHLQPEQVAASGPARLANPNSQAWYMGSGGLSTSSIAWRLRRRALSGNGGRLAYVEHTAEKVSLIDGRIVSVRPDVLDREAWAQANAAYGRRITDEALLGLYEELGPELFGRECLCLWDPEPGDGGMWPVIAEAWWRAAADPTHKPFGRIRYALDVDQNAKGETWASIGASDGTHVEEVTPLEAGPGVGWVVAACAKRKDEIGELLVAKDAPASALVPDLEAAGVRVRLVTQQEQEQASMQFYEALANGGIRHIDQPKLNAAAAGAQKMVSGDEKWRFSRKVSIVDIGPLCAVVMARWAAVTEVDAVPLVAWR